MLSKENLINYFKLGEKKSSAFKIGTEHEKFLFDIKTKKPVDFSENGKTILSRSRASRWF